MAKQKKLNKGLIGGLTIVAAIVAVASVAIVTIQNAKKDPTELAAKAKAAEDAREFNRAADLYRRAFTVNKEGKYLVDAARAAYASGEITGSIQLLNLAASQEARNVQILTAILQRYWELVDNGMTSVADTMLTHADNLLAVEPENVLALASRAFALDQARDAKASNAKDASEALDKALKLDPKNPRLAQLAVDRKLREAAEQARALLEKGRTDDAEKLAAKVREESATLLKESIAATPQARSYQYLGRLLAALGRLDEARETLEAGIKALPKETDLRLEIARVLYTIREKAGADKGRAEALLTDAVRHVDEAIKAEPAFYAAHAVRAEAQEQLWRATGEWDKDTNAKQKLLLDALIGALRDTATMKGLKAELGKFGPRQELLVAAFDRASAFHEQVPDAATKAVAIDYARRFYDEARTSYSDSPFVFIMEGQLAIMQRDTRAAIQAYTKAATLANNAPQYQRMAKERLALLHRQAGESGLSLTMTEQALALYPPNQQPRPLILNRAQLLTLLNRPKEALDYLNRLPEVLRNDPDFIKVCGEALAASGQGQLAQEQFAKLAGDVGALLGQVRTAATSGDWNAAEGYARKALEAAPENPDVVRALYIVLLQEQKLEEAKKVMADLKARPNISDAFRRVLAVYELLLSEPDADKRDTKLLELVSQISDPRERASERANFFVMRGKFQEAATEADLLEKLNPDDERIWRMQLDLAARLKNWDRAEGYLTKLAAKNVDHAQGSLLRAQVQLARGESEAALRDFRAAEQVLPTDSDLKVQIAKALLTVKPPRYTDAVDVLREASEIDPLNFEAHKLLYLCLNDALGQQGEALPHLRQAARLNPSDDLIVKRSRILEEEDDPAKGLAWREPLRKAEPKNIENLGRLAYLYDRLQQNEKAVEAVQAASALEPGNKAIAIQATNIFSRLKQRDAGVALLKSFSDAVSGPDKISALVLLARFYESLGDGAAAQATLTDVEKRAGELSGGDDTQQTRAKLVAGAELAEFFGRQDQVAPMIDAYRRVLTLTKGFPDEAARVRLRISKALLVDRQYDASEKEIAAFQKDFPQDPRGWLAEAELSIARNQYDKAVELLTKVLAGQPKHQWALFTRARVNIERRQYASATEDLIRLKSLAPTNTQSRMELARLYEITARYPEAENELRELLAVNPENRVFAARLIGVLKEANKFADAQRFVAEQSARRPDDPFWPYQLAGLFAERRDFANAVTQYRKTVELTKSRDPLALEKLMRTLIRADRTKDVPAIFEALNPDVVTPTLAGVAGEAYAKLKQTDKAAASFDRAVRSAATQPSGALSAVARQGVTSWSYADTVALIRNVAKDVKEIEASQHLRVVLARMLIESGDNALTAEGSALVETLLKEAQPGTVTHVEALLARAAASEQARDWEGAVKQYEAILKQAPDLPAALNNLSFILADELKRAAEALPYAERARQLAPDNSDFADTLGWVYLRLNKLDAAEAALLDARRLAPENLAIRYHIAQLYLQRNDKPTARRELEALSEMAKTAQDAEYIRKADEGIAQLK